MGAPRAVSRARRRRHRSARASSAHALDRPSFTIKPIGDFTAALETLAEGDSMLIDGPHGAPALVDGRDHVLIAGGSGITPAMSVLRTATEEEDPRRLRLLYFVRDEETAALRDELEALGRHGTIEVTIVPSRPREEWQGPSGRLDASLSTRCSPRTGMTGRTSFAGRQGWSTPPRPRCDSSTAATRESRSSATSRPESPGFA